MAYDLVIKNAKIIDGSGLPAFSGDVAVQDGRIAEIGKIGDSAKRVINADGLVLSPGFIDHHTHMDAHLLWDPMATSSPFHGVTSVVTGNCGLSLMPCKPEDRPALVSSLSRVEAIPREVLETAVDWQWGSVGQYLDNLDKNLGVNVASHVGHCAIRQYVMGEESSEREATPAEIEEMKEAVRDAMRAGAIGFTTNQNPRHMRLDGKPVASRMATTEEVLALAGTVGEFNTGVIEAIRGNPAIEDIDWYAQIAKASNRPVLWQVVLHMWNAPNKWRAQLDKLEESFASGVRPFGLTNANPLVRRFNMRNAQAFDESPTWRELMRQPMEARIEAFSTTEGRDKLREAFGEIPWDPNAPTWFDLFDIIGPVLPKNQHLKGKTVGEMAREQGKDALDAFLDLVIEEEFETMFQRNVSHGDDNAVGEILRSPYVLIGVSDAGAHVAFDASFGYCTFLLAEWVRKRKLMTLEAAVNKLSFMVANIFGLRDRGLIRPGWFADLTLFDPETIGALEPEYTNDYPGGTTRMIQKSTGVYYTIVNGQVIAENGEVTSARPGRVLRNSWYEAHNGTNGK
ncbi:MAG: N-acyl-D-aspartate/D-glutamate deacylase/Dihydroorotase [Chloroflexi bacterium]|jgi:N-acyl-D-aspartate/D-glutamate deacylase|nr:MAG: N-acyl-D-aspartate/D-glutamate deacylase/Dihydroorotase [Chloroflexota bacterium]